MEISDPAHTDMLKDSDHKSKTKSLGPSLLGMCRQLSVSAHGLFVNIYVSLIHTDIKSVVPLGDD